MPTRKIIITVSNLHCSAARKGGDFPNKQEYYDMLFEHFVNDGLLLLATDAGMSLLGTRTMVTQACARYREKH